MLKQNRSVSKVVLCSLPVLVIACSQGGDGTDDVSTARQRMLGGEQPASDPTPVVGLERREPNGTWTPQCSGLLVEDNVVLTAAHCVTTEFPPAGQQGSSNETFPIAAGEWRVCAAPGSPNCLETIAVESLTIQPDWFRRREARFDFALVKLASASTRGSAPVSIAKWPESGVMPAQFRIHSAQNETTFHFHTRLDVGNLGLLEGTWSGSSDPVDVGIESGDSGGPWFSLGGAADWTDAAVLGVTGFTYHSEEEFSSGGKPYTRHPRAANVSAWKAVLDARIHHLRNGSSATCDRMLTRNLDPSGENWAVIEKSFCVTSGSAPTLEIWGFDGAGPDETVLERSIALDTLPPIGDVSSIGIGQTTVENVYELLILAMDGVTETLHAGEIDAEAGDFTLHTSYPAPDDLLDAVAQGGSPFILPMQLDSDGAEEWILGAGNRGVGIDDDGSLEGYDQYRYFTGDANGDDRVDAVRIQISGTGDSHARMIFGGVANDQHGGSAALTGVAPGPASARLDQFYVDGSVRRGMLLVQDGWVLHWVLGADGKMEPIVGPYNNDGQRQGWIWNRTASYAEYTRAIAANLVRNADTGAVEAIRVSFEPSGTSSWSGQVAWRNLNLWEPIRAATMDTTVVLLDQTGSMIDNGFWDIALAAAQSAVAAHGALITTGLAAPSRYAIYTFRNGGGQRGAAKVWPSSTNPCPSSEEDGYCLMGDSEDFLGIGTVLADVQNGAPPESSWLTPLAGGLCDALEALRQIPGQKRVLLETDLQENNTDPLHWCSGVDSGDFTIDTSELDWGITVADAWQLKTLRRAFRLSSEMSEAVGLAIDGPELPQDLDWWVDLHYGLVQEVPAALLASAGTPFTAPSRRVVDSSAAPVDRAPRDVAVPTAFEGTLLAPVARAASAAGTVVTPLPGELALLRALGSATAGSRVVEYVASPDDEYGVEHPVAGDVDDSGCADSADLSILLQQDVWMHRAVEPNQLAVRADLSRDGWVNYDDLAVLYANWGAGCQNPVMPPEGPPLPSTFDHCIDFTLSKDETDVDCGGSCQPCPNGASCEVDTDCEAEVCTDGLCGISPTVDPCECRPAKCNDCAGPIAQCEAVPGCLAIVECVLNSPCSFPHESCVGNLSCFDATGYPQSSPAGQAANGVISCMGGC